MNYLLKQPTASISIVILLIAIQACGVSTPSTPTMTPQSTISATTPTTTPEPAQVPGLIAFAGPSEDGKMTLWLMNENGEERYAPLPSFDNAGTIDWSPSGLWLAFNVFDDGKDDIMLFDPLELQQHYLDSGNTMGWSWSPDGEKLAYFLPIQDSCRIGIYSPDSGMSRELETEIFPASCSGPYWITGWSFDNRYIFIDAGTGTSRHLWVVDTLDDYKVADLENIIYRSVAISPDGKSLALDLTKGSEGSADGLYDPSVTIINLQTGKQQKVIVGEFNDDRYTVLDWLPDGRILFTWTHSLEDSYWYFNPEENTEPVPANDYQVSEIDLGAIQERLHDNSQWIRSYSLSPDKTQLVILIADGEKEMIYLMNRETGDFSEPIEGRNPVWQPVYHPVSPQLKAYITTESSPNPTSTSTPAIKLATMQMKFWNAWFSYDPKIWQVGGHPYSPSITHRQIPTCIIFENGPTEPPQVDKTVNLGQVRYNVAELFLNGLHVDWYMAVRGPNGPFAGGLPTLIVKVPPDQRVTCLADALIVLATLTDAKSDVSDSDFESAPTVSDFSCSGALPTRLSIEGYAYVSLNPPLANRVRSGPGKQYSIIGHIQPGKGMQILDSPICANKWVWWKVEEIGTGLVGWTAEGNSQEYWLIPCSSKDECGK